jgi:hypothetical protein
MSKLTHNKRVGTVWGTASSLTAKFRSAPCLPLDTGKLSTGKPTPGQPAAVLAGGCWCRPTPNTQQFQTAALRAHRTSGSRHRFGLSDVSRRINADSASHRQLLPEDCVQRTGVLSVLDDNLLHQECRPDIAPQRIRACQPWCALPCFWDARGRWNSFLVRQTASGLPAARSLELTAVAGGGGRWCLRVPGCGGWSALSTPARRFQERQAALFAASKLPAK